MTGFGSGLIPSPWSIVHIARFIDETVTDEHGNHPVVEDPPVVRKVYSITQFGRRGSSREVMGDEFAERIESELHMACNDPTLYGHSDRIILDADFDAAGDWIPDTGVAYWVNGDPSDEREGPWPLLLQWSGGLVKIKRVS